MITNEVSNEQIAEILLTLHFSVTQTMIIIVTARVQYVLFFTLKAAATVVLKCTMSCSALTLETI